MIWERVLGLASKIEERFAATGQLQPEVGPEYDWYNRIFSSDTYRRAHIEIVDRRADFKILILHCTIFPHYNDPSPIWGFDAVCGASKITGAFHDLSSGGVDDHPILKWFEAKSKSLTWKRKRELPEWAAEIFSPHIVAAGNVSDPDELDSLEELALSSLDFYLQNVGAKTDVDYYPVQLKYNQNNKLNPHVRRSMISMGVPEPVIDRFIAEVLYPEAR